MIHPPLHPTEAAPTETRPEPEREDPGSCSSSGKGISPLKKEFASPPRLLPFQTLTPLFSTNSKTAVVLAGGVGKRLAPYTASIPKPLLPIQSTPLLKIILDQLTSHGYERIILATHYKSDLIEEYCGNGKKWGLSIEYTKEKNPLGTMGPLKIIDQLPDNFLIMNGDILTDFDFGKFHEEHVKEKNLFTMGSFEYVENLPYGIIETEDQKLVSFREKPSIRRKINMGIYMAHKKILDYIPNEIFFGLNDLIPALIGAKEAVGVVSHSGKWIDIGTPLQYQEAQTFGIV